MAVAVLAMPVGLPSAEFVDVDRDNIVLSRSRPEYDAQGIALGAFRAYPQLTIGSAYDDNIFDRIPARGDVFFDISPHLSIQSGWSQHFLQIIADAQIERFARITSENNDRYSFAALGRLNVTHDVMAELDAVFARSAETRGSAGDAVAGSRPIIFYDAGGHATFTATSGALTVKARVDLDQFTYRDAQVGNQYFSQAYRNHLAVAGLVEASYPLGPQVSGIVSASYNQATYTKDLQTSVPLDSHGYAFLGGVHFGLTSVTSGQISAGYLRQSYQSPVFPTIEGVNYDARIVWNPTTLLAVTATARRTIEPSPIANVAGIVADAAGVKADYEVLRNLLVTVRTDYVREAYRGNDRRDRRITGDAGVRYLINRTLQLGLNYDYRDQASRGTGARPYRGSAVLLQLTVKR